MSAAELDGYETDTVTRLETNLDDCPAEMLGRAMEMLLAGGALDVWFTPIQMKKHRPGVMLSVLCEPGLADQLLAVVFRETTAFGLRKEEVVRVKLARRFETVATAYGEITVKLGVRHGQVVQVAPEYESCRAASERHERPFREIFAAALRAWESRADTAAP